jgi:hypothetical protein
MHSSDTIVTRISGDYRASWIKPQKNNAGYVWASFSEPETKDKRYRLIFEIIIEAKSHRFELWWRPDPSRFKSGRLYARLTEISISNILSKNNILDKSTFDAFGHWTHFKIDSFYMKSDTSFIYPELPPSAPLLSDLNSELPESISDKEITNTSLHFTSCDVMEAFQGRALSEEERRRYAEVCNPEAIRAEAKRQLEFEQYILEMRNRLIEKDKELLRKNERR